MDIKELIENSDRAEMIEWLTDHIGDSTKCVILTGEPDNKGGLNLGGQQMGFKYSYELYGFLSLFADDPDMWKDDD